MGIVYTYYIRFLGKGICNFCSIYINWVICACIDGLFLYSKFIIHPSCVRFLLSLSLSLSLFSLLKPTRLYFFLSYFRLNLVYSIFKLLNILFICLINNKILLCQLKISISTFYIQKHYEQIIIYLYFKLQFQKQI